MEALRSIKVCVLSHIGFVALGVVFIIVLDDGEDRPPGGVIGAFIAR